MLERVADSVRDVPELREKTRVFEDRAHAGRALGDLLAGACDAVETVLLAIPAGGVPVGAALADRLDLPLDAAVVSKITLPSNTEVGCGAVAWDGSVKLNRRMLDRVGLGGDALRKRIDATAEKVRRREAEFRRGREPLDLRGKQAVLVDDGLASGFTMRLAVEAAGKLQPDALGVAAPTAPLTTVMDLAGCVDRLWVANIRTGRFAVADVYRTWYDVSEREAADLLNAQTGSEP